MASSLNRVEIIGRLGRKPELKQVGGSCLCELAICTNEPKQVNGQWDNIPCWHRVQVWNKQAEYCANYLDVGVNVRVEGKLSYRSYEKDGQKHYVTDIVAKDIMNLGGGKGNQGGAPSSVPTLDPSQRRIAENIKATAPQNSFVSELNPYGQSAPTQQPQQAPTPAPVQQMPTNDGIPF